MQRSITLANGFIFAMTVAFGVGVGVNIQAIPNTERLELTAEVSINKAEAGPARRSYRRTARRTSRRTSSLSGHSAVMVFVPSRLGEFQPEPLTDRRSRSKSIVTN